MKRFKHMGRRAFLRGTGGTIMTLPLLEYTHEHALAQGSLPKRFLTVFSHGGTISNQASGKLHSGTGSHHGEDWWKPSDPGESLVLGPIHQPLDAFRNKLMVLQGIDNRAAISHDQYNQGAHGTANATVLTCADLTGDKSTASPQGPSIDFVLADRLAQTYSSKLKRIHLMVGGHQYGSPYFQAAGQRVSGERDPAAAYKSIFDGVTASGEAPDPALVRREKLRESALNGIMEEYHQLRTRVSTADAHIVDAHLEHLYALEKEITDFENASIMCDPSTAQTSTGDGAGGKVIGDLHAKIIVAALRCGLTNVANLEIADILTPWTPTGTPMNSAHGIGHSLGHYAREVGPQGANAHQLDTWLAEMQDNRRWRIGLLKQILEGLDAVPEGDGTMLDNSLILYTSEFSDPAKHIAWNTPVLLAGTAGGYFRTGRHLNYNKAAASDPNTLSYETDQSMHNLHTSILQAFGGSDSHFGNGAAYQQGPLPGLQ